MDVIELWTQFLVELKNRKLKLDIYGSNYKLILQQNPNDHKWWSYFKEITRACVEDEFEDEERGYVAIFSTFSHHSEMERLLYLMPGLSNYFASECLDHLMEYDEDCYGPDELEEAMEIRAQYYK